jgi:hypothetical protein
MMNIRMKPNWMVKIVVKISPNADPNPPLTLDTSEQTSQAIARKSSIMMMFRAKVSDFIALLDEP